MDMYFSDPAVSQILTYNHNLYTKKIVVSYLGFVCCSGALVMVMVHLEQQQQQKTVISKPLSFCRQRQSH